jgi:hypothetical protein
VLTVYPMTQGMTSLLVYHTVLPTYLLSYYYYLLPSVLLVLIHIHSTLSTLKECSVYTYISKALSSRSRLPHGVKYPLNFHTHTYFILYSDCTLFCCTSTLDKYDDTMLCVLCFLFTKHDFSIRICSINHI